MTQGMVAYVDAVDYERVRDFKWYPMKSRHTTYACARVRIDGKQKTILMHRLLMDAPSGILVDHIDRNGLRCTRQNMRFATQAQNQFNQAVRWKSDRKKWLATIRFDGKNIHIGYFLAADAAARAYDDKAAALFGEFASLNFPRGNYDHKTAKRKPKDGAG
jgi:hypothetical protein